MLTVKSIGGGGAAEVTNGVLQEYASAGEEIPKNTFVQLVETLQFDEGHTGGKLTNQPSLNEGITFSHIVELAKGRYFMFSDSDLTGAVCTVKEDVVEVGPSVPVITSTQKASNVYSVHLIRRSENEVQLLYMAYFTPTSNYIYSDICTVSGTDISVKSQKVTSTAFSQTEFTAEKLSDNMVAVLYAKQKVLYINVWTVNADGSLTQREEKALSSRTSYRYVECQLIRLSDTSVICSFRLNYGEPVLNTVCRIAGAGISVGTDTSGIDLKKPAVARGSGEGFWYFAEEGSIPSQVKAFPVSINGMILTKGEAVPVLSPVTEGSSVLSYKLYAAMQVSEAQILLLVSQQEHVSFGGGNYTAKGESLGIVFFNTDENAAENLTGQFISFDGLPLRYGYEPKGSQIVTGGMNPTEIAFDAEKNQACFVIDPMKNAVESAGILFGTVQLGESLYTVQPAANRIDGLTKSAVTPDKKGLVWSLNTPP